jgi:hypothetical protein
MSSENGSSASATRYYIESLSDSHSLNVYMGLSYEHSGTPHLGLKRRTPRPNNMAPIGHSASSAGIDSSTRLLHHDSLSCLGKCCEPPRLNSAPWESVIYISH